MAWIAGTLLFGCVSIALGSKFLDDGRWVRPAVVLAHSSAALFLFAKLRPEFTSLSFPNRASFWFSLFLSFLVWSVGFLGISWTPQANLSPARMALFGVVVAASWLLFSFALLYRPHVRDWMKSIQFQRWLREASLALCFLFVWVYVFWLGGIRVLLPSEPTLRASLQIGGFVVVPVALLIQYALTCSSRRWRRIYGLLALLVIARTAMEILWLDPWLLVSARRFDGQTWFGLLGLAPLLGLVWAVRSFDKRETGPLPIFSARPAVRRYRKDSAVIWYGVFMVIILHAVLSQADWGIASLAAYRQTVFLAVSSLLIVLGVIHERFLAPIGDLSGMRSSAEANQVPAANQLGNSLGNPSAKQPGSQSDLSRLRHVERDLRFQKERRVDLEETLRRSEDRYQVLVETMNEGMCVIDVNGLINYVNSALCRMLGYARHEMIGQNLTRFFSSEDGKVAYERFLGTKNGLEEPYEIPWHTSHSMQIISLVSPRAVRDESDRWQGCFLVVTDISSRKKIEEEMRLRANYDPLTELPNRAFFRDQLEKVLERARLEDHGVAVFFLDLDRFKRINDSLGHAVGDLLLWAVAKRLREAVGEHGLVARLSGDEFTFVFSDVSDYANVVSFVEKVQNAFRNPFRVDEFELSVTPSIGISLFPADGRSAQELVKNADAAMYHAKMQGRNNYQFYTDAMNKTALQRLTMENRLREALEQKQFKLLYQPKVELKSGKMVGVEALIRWPHPELGLISPTNFIPVAEDTGLIGAISGWLLETACAQAKEWQRKGWHDTKVAVNLSAIQFKSETLPARVLSALAKAELQPEALELEITESLAMENAEMSIVILSQLRALGVGIALDDFGTGYSSLNYLKRFPITKLKVDRCFIDDVPENSVDAAIVSAIIAMGHGLGVRVIGEGVERQTQLDFLDGRGCDEVQGYLISRPVEPEIITEMMGQDLLKGQGIPG